MPIPNRGNVVPPLEQSTRGQAHPLAATIALRSMVDFTLANARSSRYSHAAHHLQSCERLSQRIADWGEIPSHGAYLAAIGQNHARKSSFWKRMQEIGMAQAGLGARSRPGPLKSIAALLGRVA